MTRKIYEIQRTFESILAAWGIQSEAERWSLKTKFLRENPEYYTFDDFEGFLEERYGSRSRLRKKSDL